ncbi:hypothetical protein LL999_25625 [Burkholderia ambifaria]|uniref:hypothetical protein n=1 Tax=Burkholderia ambifaria TaxID=152480 RepID=UPI001E5D155A|nr:hypothetical protein [Burkholderia ambifaria]UEP23612.1 hypothetical protein LL999_25625 [Burkholderia ambifaria]WAS56709.1 hypothetical protein MK974_26860 [Burkholderia ambifaria]
MRNVIGQSFLYGSDAPHDHRAAATSRVPVNFLLSPGAARNARRLPIDHRGSVSEEPVSAKEVNRLWVANTRAANEISELRCEELSSSSMCTDGAGPRDGGPGKEKDRAVCAKTPSNQNCAG